MAKPLLPNELWEKIKPFHPPVKPNPKDGSLRVPNQLPLTGILFVAKDRNGEGTVATVVGLRQWHDLLAAPAGLAGCRSLAKSLEGTP